MRGRGGLLALALALAACGEEQSPNSSQGVGGDAGGGESPSSGAGQPAGGTAQDDLATCTESYSASGVEATFGLTCLPESFAGQARLTDLDLRSPTVIANASFMLEGVPTDASCGTAPLLTYRGRALPEFRVDARFHVELQFNDSGRRHSSAAISIYDEAGKPLVGWFWQDIGLLPDVSFVAALGLELSAAPVCEVSDPCVTSLAYNRLNVTHQEESVQVEIGQEYEFEAGGVAYVLGVNGGSLRRGPLAPGCADASLGNDVVFAVVPQ